MSENQRTQAMRFLRLLRDNPEGLKEDVIRRKMAIGSDSTFYRIVKTARETFKTTVKVQRNKYILQQPCKIPDESGFTLSDDELICLATLQHIISCMTAGTLSDFFIPLSKRMEALLKSTAVSRADLEKHIQILDAHFRTIKPGVFSRILTSMASERVIKFNYTDSRNRCSERIVSPLHLVRYKDNWYCDAWCHTAEELRIFSLDGIGKIRYHNAKYRQPDQEHIQNIYATSYGIFSGVPTDNAIIRFSGIAAHYVLREQWHPCQKVTKCKDGSIILEVPYGKPHELIREILSWGGDAEVVEPEPLRKEVTAELRKAVEKY